MAGQYLVDAGQGDEVYFNHLTNTHPVPGETCTVVSESAHLTGLTMSDGSATPVTALMATPPSGSFRLALDGAGFNTLLPGMRPPTGGPTAPSASVKVYCQPTALSSGPMASRPALLSWSPSASAATALTDLGDCPFGDPYPAAWYRWLAINYVFQASLLGPSATTPVLLPVELTTMTSTFPGAGTPLAPQISPVRNPTIAGADLFQTQTGFGLTPTLDWATPSLGIPGWYRIELYEVTTLTGGNTTLSDEPSVLTLKQPPFQVPPGLLQSGHAYAFKIFAMQEPGRDIATVLERSSIPTAYATLVSAAR
jgi:hypothetical protein